MGHVHQSKSPRRNKGECGARTGSEVVFIGCIRRRSRLLQHCCRAGPLHDSLSTVPAIEAIYTPGILDVNQLFKLLLT